MSSRTRTIRLVVEGAVSRARDQVSKAVQLVDRPDEGNRDQLIHEVRKRIKKARALVQLARGSVGRKVVARLDRRLREAARPISAIRDASVLVETLDALAGRSDDPAEASAFARARVALLEQRDRVASQQLDEGHALARTSKALRSTPRRLARWDLAGHDAVPIGAYKRAYRRGRETFEAASEGPTSEALHELRKRVKALVPQLGVLDADPTGPVARLQRLARLLAGELGEVHDLDVLRDFIASLDEASPILKPLDRHRLDLRRVALQRAGVVYFDRPRTFAGMVEEASAGVEADPIEK